MDEDLPIFNNWMTGRFVWIFYNIDAVFTDFFHIFPDFFWFLIIRYMLLLYYFDYFEHFPIGKNILKGSIIDITSIILSYKIQTYIIAFQL